MEYIRLTRLARKKLIKEAIDADDLEHLGAAIDNFDNLLTNNIGDDASFKLPEIYKGIQKANSLFDEFISHDSSLVGKIQNFIGAAMAKGSDTSESRNKGKSATLLADMLVYLASLTQAFRVMPMIVNRFAKEAAKKPNDALVTSLDDIEGGEISKIRKGLIAKFHKALIPAKQLGIGSKLPYGVNIAKAADELLTLTPAELNKIAAAANEINVPATAREVAQLVKATKPLRRKEEQAPDIEAMAASAAQAATPGTDEPNPVSDEEPDDEYSMTSKKAPVIEPELNLTPEPRRRESDPRQGLPVIKRSEIEKAVTKGISIPYGKDEEQIFDAKHNPIPKWKVGFTNPESRKQLVDLIVQMLRSSPHRLPVANNESFDLASQQKVKAILKEANLYQMLSEVADETGLSLTELIVLLRRNR